MNYLSMRQVGLIVVGAFITMAGILLATSFFYVENHSWYWNTPHILCVITLLLCAIGSFLIGHNLSKRRMTWVITVGIIFILAWAITGLFSFSFTFLGANYLSGYTYVNWDSYYGDYLVGSFNIMSLVIAASAGLIGGFLLGFGFYLRPRGGHVDVAMLKKHFMGKNG